MLSKKLVRIAAAFLAAVLLLTAPVFADSDGPRRSYTPTVELSLARGLMEHVSYINGYPDGSFRPENNVTRAEAAMMLYSLLEKSYPDRVGFADVAKDDWYYDAIGLLAAGGIIEVTDYKVYPNEALTRAEFVSMLSRFYPAGDYECAYSDVPADSEYYEHIAKATAMGWVQGYPDGSFGVDRLLTRAEAAAMINRATGRTADAGYVDGEISVPLFTDIFAEHWAYYTVMEAAVGHTHGRRGSGEEYWRGVEVNDLRRPGGFFYVGVDFYYIDPETGWPVTDTQVGSFMFGPDGRYTSGDAEIDGYVTAALESVVSPGMSREEMLREAFLWTRDSFTYLRRNYYELGHTGWTLEDARVMFQTGRGNCYCYAAVFYYLCRQLGYEATPIAGQVGHARDPHGWVEIDFDGVTYIFDTELEMAYRKKGVYYYDFYMMSYARVPWPYVR